uniref:carbonic anhydrase n=1 Tax=Chlamydomonas sp. ICE-L TaxID=309537 RepID=A0A2P0ZWG4_9CHLO|nr:alpha-carbonic anhydrase 4 [Chlamydomonas sp. ICE-L]
MLLSKGSSSSTLSRNPQRSSRQFSHLEQLLRRSNGQVAGVKTSSSNRDEVTPLEGAAGEASKPQLITKLVREPNKIKRRGLMMAGAAAMFGCACCADVLSSAKANEWGYGGEAPASWPGVCTTGGRQSPINVTLAPKIKSAQGKTKYPVTPIKFNYGRREKVEVLNTGHGTMQVNFKAGNSAYVPPRFIPSDEVSAYPGDSEQNAGPCLCPSKPMDLELIQYHFHTPSEHYLDGEQTIMEAHLVHRNRYTGGLAVIAVLIRSGGSTPNPCLQLGLDFGPEESGRRVPARRAANPYLLLPAKNADRVQPYVHYQGSLTTPPCSESVDWFVMTNTIKATDKQVIDFMRYSGGGFGYKQNSRPVQEMNARMVEYFEYDI